MLRELVAARVAGWAFQTRSSALTPSGFEWQIFGAWVSARSK